MKDKLKLGKQNKMLSIALDKDTHRMYTNDWRQLIPYNKKYIDEELETKIVEAAASIYLKDPRLMGTVLFSLRG